MKRVCSHRGFEFEGETCPYHGLSIPPRKGCFLSEREPSAPFDEFTARRMDDRLGQCFASYKFQIECPFYLWMMNTADPNHLSSVHTPGFSKMFDDGELPYDVQISEDRLRSSYKIKVKKSVVDSYETRFPGLQDYFFHGLGFPGTSVTSFLGVFYSLESAIPLSKTTCQVTTDFWTSKLYKYPNALLAGAAEGNLRILGQDRNICERWAKSFDPKRHLKNFLPGEERLRVYAEMIEERGMW